MEANLHKIKILKSDIEEKLGRSVKSPIDFNHLSYNIKKKTKEEISVSTLKRIWEYVPSSHKPRISTLSLLSRYLGFRDWDSYCLSIKTHEFIEESYVVEKVVSKALNVGNRIEIGWSPNRYCLLEFIGDSKFIVIDAKNTKIQNEDTFSVEIFEINHPFVITDLVQKNTNGVISPENYKIAISQTGLTRLSIVTK